MKNQVTLALVAVTLAAFCIAQPANACPFCSAVSQTFSEEMTSMDVVVIAKLVETPNTNEANNLDPAAELTKSKFEVVRAIKGDQWLKDAKVIETLYFGQAKVGETFLLMGADPPNIMWSTPLLLSQRAQEYVTKVLSLPNTSERLAFFMKYLEDSDEMLARDAYDEFAKAPYQDVIARKDDMDHDQLISWIKNTDIPVSRRRLYLTMLGICGSSDDTPMLEEMLRSDDRSAKAGLDALIACYLLLKGPDGMPLVEELFLKNSEAEYADTYSAIMALRFHGSETDRIPRERLLVGLRYMLERPQLADLVIPDLARWEDWSVMDRLVELFKTADEGSSWVRVPVVNYLRACPLPEADEKIKLLAQVDPDAVKRASTFFPFATGSGASKKDVASNDTETTTPSENSTASESLLEDSTNDDVEANANSIVTDAEITESNAAVSSVAADKETDDATNDPIVNAATLEQGSNAEEPVTTTKPEDAGNAVATESNAAATEPNAAATEPSVEFEKEQTPAPAEATDEDQLASAPSTSDSQVDSITPTNVSLFVLLGVPFMMGILLLGVLWLTLRGAGGQLKQ